MLIEPTFIPIANTIKIDIVVVAKEKKTKPRIKAIDWHNEQDANDPTLFWWQRIVFQMFENLNKSKN